jgi:hypothetical protein
MPQAETATHPRHASLPVAKHFKPSAVEIEAGISITLHGSSTKRRGKGR